MIPDHTEALLSINLEHPRWLECRDRDLPVPLEPLLA
jgi:hypothetical protein